MEPAAGSIFLTVCEYAGMHQDGTFSLVRGGIDRVTVDGLPAILTFFFFVEAAANALAVGEHSFAVDLGNAEGIRLFHLGGRVNVEVADRVTRIIIPAGVQFQAGGKFTVSATLGGVSVSRHLVVGRAEGGPSSG